MSELDNFPQKNKHSEAVIFCINKLARSDLVYEWHTSSGSIVPNCQLKNLYANYDGDKKNSRFDNFEGEYSRRGRANSSSPRRNDK